MLVCLLKLENFGCTSSHSISLLFDDTRIASSHFAIFPTGTVHLSHFEDKTLKVLRKLRFLTLEILKFYLGIR